MPSLPRRPQSPPCKAAGAPSSRSHGRDVGAPRLSPAPFGDHAGCVCAGPQRRSRARRAQSRIWPAFRIDVDRARRRSGGPTGRRNPPPRPVRSRRRNRPEATGTSRRQLTTTSRKFTKSGRLRPRTFRHGRDEPLSLRTVKWCWCGCRATRFETEVGAGRDDHLRHKPGRHLSAGRARSLPAPVSEPAVPSSAGRWLPDRQHLAPALHSEAIARRVNLSPARRLETG